MAVSATTFTACWVTLFVFVLHSAKALFICKGKTSGVVNGGLIAKDGTCTVSENTIINGPIFVRNKASISILDGAVVNGNIQLNSAQNFFSSGKYKVVTINGQITDIGGSGTFLLCGTRISSRVRILRRVGEIVIGFGSCSPSEINRPVLIAGGKGDIMISGQDDGNVPLKGDLTGLSITNRNSNSDVFLWQTSILQNLNIVKAGNLYLKDLVVLGQTKLVKNIFVSLFMFKSFGPMKIGSTTNLVTGSDVVSKSTALISNNANGFVFSESTFNKISCFGNSGIPIAIEGSSVATGKGQCSVFET